MTSSQERSRNNVRAGIFVTISLLLALAVIMMLTDIWNTVTRRVNEYIVTFPLETGVGNLRAGSKVLIGGVELGSVEYVMPAFTGNGDVEIVEVIFEVDERVQLFSDAQIFVIAPLIGAEASLAISSVGSPNAGAPASGRITGVAGSTLLTSLLGPTSAQRTTEILDNASDAMANARELTEFLTSIEGEYFDRIVPLLDDLKASGTDVRTLVAGLREDQWPRWAGRLDEIMNWAVATTEDLDATIEEGRGVATDARAILADNRPRIDQAVTNVEDASDRIRTMMQQVEEETIAKVHDLLDSGQEGLDSATASIHRIQQDYEGWSVDLGEVIGNASLASQQLKLATVEVRRSPWKLLYRPTADELEHELLYESTRSFAVAAADLKAASISVQRILDNHGEQLADDVDALARVQGSLQESLDRYLAAQQRLFDVLLMDSP